MAQRAIKQVGDLERWIEFLRNQALPITVSCIKGVNRSKMQNALFHKWCSQIGDEIGQDMIEVKAECKARFGLPIMKRDCPAWIEKWEPLYGPLPYEMKLQLFEVIPMTSEMKVKQMSEMMDAIQRHYRNQGYNLIDPELMKYGGQESLAHGGVA